MFQQGAHNQQFGLIPTMDQAQAIFVPAPVSQAAQPGTCAQQPQQPTGANGSLPHGM